MFKLRGYMNKLDTAILKHIKKLVLEDNRPFSYRDLLYFIVDDEPYQLDDGSIRNKLLQFKKEKRIKLCYRSKVAFYTLPGYEFGKDKLMTLNHTVDNIISDSWLRNHPVYKILERAYFGKLAIHNLHMVFKIKGIYESLSNSKLINADMERGNESIAFKTYFIEKYTIIVNVYTTDTVKVTIGCSENPIILDCSGIIHFTSILTRIEERLQNDIDSYCETQKYNLPSFMEWTIVLWHIGRDTMTEYEKDMFHCKWDLVEKITLRIYAKKINNHKRIRAELQFDPDLSLKALLMKLILNP